MWILKRSQLAGLSLLSLERLTHRWRGVEHTTMAEMANRLFHQIRGDVVGKGAGAEGADADLPMLGDDFLQIGPLDGVQASDHHIARAGPALYFPGRLRLLRWRGRIRWPTREGVGGWRRIGRRLRLRLRLNAALLGNARVVAHHDEGALLLALDAAWDRIPVELRLNAPGQLFHLVMRDPYL